ncbi:hypothetical protein BOTCAL_0379g00060 [Botryotinia calthae]|uniref:Uncharacterized protein n=1 Tax=Botryotinia calthae TaxID=38488 RepID=A0A4Y8CRI4_9HELO|nr:hypothetical protein BOTCAL_0379g00060 [Botryotinia calthae]
MPNTSIPSVCLEDLADLEDPKALYLSFLISSVGHLEGNKQQMVHIADNEESPLNLLYISSTSPLASPDRDGGSGGSGAADLPSLSLSPSPVLLRR